MSHEPYSVCITCCGFFTDALRCKEYAGWDVVVVEDTRSYQSKLACCHSRYACSKWQGGTLASGNLHRGQDGSGDVVTEPERVDSLSSVDFVSLQDLASWAGHALPLEGQLASLLAQGSLLQFMLSEKISPQVTAYLNNLASLPASLLSQAECVATSRPTPPES